MRCCRCTDRATEKRPAYLYVLVRTDIPPSQVAVQAIHAALEHARTNHIEKSAEHPHLVLLSVPDSGDLWQAWGRLQHTYIPHVCYREPDASSRRGTQPDDDLTAICCGPVYNDDRAFFRDYRLLKGA